ncbi:MAG: hypothetical protein HUJ68_03545 [Clostridia bacterium]|nr:hypothetical protein [Clostridia bacterium]
MTLLVEGCDNVGKGTQIEFIKNYVENKYNCPVHYMHYSNIKGKSSSDDIRKISEELYKQMFDIVGKDYGNCLIICDRSHLGEAVYSPIYRNYSGDYVFDIEKEAIKNTKVGLLVFTESVENLIKRDDGLSFSIDPDKKKDEIDRFKVAFDKSSLFKKHIELNNRGKDEIFEQEVRPFIDELFN